METLKDLIKRFIKWEYCGLVVLVVIVLLLHTSIMMQPSQNLFDELHYVPDARIVMDGDVTARPEHPPLSKLFLIAGMELFGDNQIGWRFFPVVFSLAGIVFFYLICRRLNLSKKASFIATFILGLENLTFVHGGIAMLDIYSVTFTLCSFWLYLKGKYAMSGMMIGISALAKLTGSLAALVIGLHWMLNGGLLKIWRQFRIIFRLLTHSVKRRWRLLLWFLTARVWKRLRFIPIMLVVTPITFIALMPIFDYGVFHKWMNPIERIQKMMEISGSITYDWVEVGTGSRPWMWVLTPEVMPYWYTPHYTGMISPTLWVFIIPVILYIIYKAIKGNTAVLFPFSWFIGTYLFWIPISLITDRVTYLFYFYPTVGAIALGLTIIAAPLLNKANGRGLIAIYLLAHTIAFFIISPVALCWSIPLCLLLYIFTFWYTGLGEGLSFRRESEPAEIQIDMPVDMPVDMPSEQ